MNVSNLKVSIVTPVYNRVELISRSVDSSLTLVQHGIASEIIIIDDASSDGLYEYVTQNYHAQITAKQIKFFQNEINRGVTFSKNLGVEKAENDWIIFMDSDDRFTNAASHHIQGYFERYTSRYDIVFFRVINMHTKQLIGNPMGSVSISLDHLLNKGTPGECLPMIKKEVLEKIPYDATRRGSEGLTYLKQVSAGFTLFIDQSVCREYDDRSDNRLSSLDQRIIRSRELFLGNVSLFRYIRIMTWRKLITTFVKIFWFFLLILLKYLRNGK